MGAFNAVCFVLFEAPFQKTKNLKKCMELENTMGMGLDIYLGWRRSDCKKSVAQLSWDNF